RPGQDPNAGLRDLRARPRGDDPQAGLGGPRGVRQRDVSDVLRPGLPARRGPARGAALTWCVPGDVFEGSHAAMYAIIRTGGKQYKVEAGQQLEVELVGEEEGSEVALDPVLVVDGSRVLATPDQLGGASVRARVLGETKGPKIHGFVYKPKSNQRRRFG